MTKRTNVYQLLSIVLVLSIGFIATNAALAVPIAPGNTGVALAGTTSVASPDLAAVARADPVRPFEIRDNLNNVILTGNLQDRVAESNNTGTLIFAPRLRDLANPTGGPTTWITGMEIVGYNGFTTDVNFRTDGVGDVGADRVTRSADGSELFFSYGTSLIVPPDEARFLSIFTNATVFAPVGTATIFAQNDFGGDVFSVTLQGINVPVVPEPAITAPLALGLLTLAAASRSAVR